MKLARFAGLLLVSSLAVGCMGGDDATPEDNPPPAATPSPSPAGADSAAVTIDSTATSTTTHN